MNPERLDDLRKETLVIVNPAAHNLPSKKALAAADHWLRSQGWQVAWEETKKPGEATQLAGRAAEKNLPLVFVCGGDGTLREAANGLIGSDTAIAVIPAGTVNIWARETKTPQNPLKAIRLALEGERHCIDLGRAGQQHFILMAGYGLDGLIARKVSLRAKRYAGAAAYALTAVRESLRYRSVPVRLSIDGQELAAPTLMLVAGNSRNYAGLVHVTPHALVDDGLLDVCVFLGQGLLDITMHMLRVILGRHLGSQKVIYRRARHVELTWDQPLPLQLDGDACQETPTTIEIVPQALCVMVPAGVRLPVFSQ